MAIRRRGTGRRKVSIQKIQDRDRLHTCFSKRRRGLFHMAAELSVFCGAEVAVILFSPGGRPFSFGSSSVDAVLRPMLSPTQDPEWQADQKKDAIGVGSSFLDFLAGDIPPAPTPAASSSTPSTSRFFPPVEESEDAEEEVADAGTSFLDLLGDDAYSLPSSRHPNRIQESEDAARMFAAERSTFFDSIGDLGLVIAKGSLF